MITYALCIISHHSNGIQRIEDGEEEDVISGRLIGFLQSAVVGCYPVWRPGRERERDDTCIAEEKKRDGACIARERECIAIHTDLVIS